MQFDPKTALFTTALRPVTYNGDGTRAAKTVAGTTTLYLVDDRNPSGYTQVLEEWTLTSTSTNLNRVYSYGVALLSQKQGSATYYFVPDGHGSTRLLTDNAGNVANTFTYDAYGTLIASNAAAQTVYLYCGEQFDPDLGFYYLRARYYKPDTGRFLTMDTAAVLKEDPLSLHRYTYCQDDPPNASDPLGLSDRRPNPVPSGITNVLTEKYLKQSFDETYTRLNGRILSMGDEEVFDTWFYDGKRRDVYWVYRGVAYRGNEVNYIGIGMYEACWGHSIGLAHAVTWAWKAREYGVRPNEKELYWLDRGYYQYILLRTEARLGTIPYSGWDINSIPDFIVEP